jgi:hypothetical protein
MTYRVVKIEYINRDAKVVKTEYLPLYAIINVETVIETSPDVKEEIKTITFSVYERVETA